MKLFESRLTISLVYLLLVASMLGMAALFASDPQRWTVIGHLQSVSEGICTLSGWQSWRILLVTEVILTAMTLGILFCSEDDGDGKAFVCGWCIAWPVVLIFIAICRAVSLFITWHAEPGLYYFFGELLFLFCITAAVMFVFQVFLLLMTAVSIALGGLEAVL